MVNNGLTDTATEMILMAAARAMGRADLTAEDIVAAIDGAEVYLSSESQSTLEPSFRRQARFTVEVTEIRHVPVVYTVEADSENEARTKASIGDTIDETDNGGSFSVNERIVENISLV